MAGKNRVEIAKKVLVKYAGQEMFLETLKAVIRKELTGNERTVLDYLFLMRNQGLITELNKGGYTKWGILPEELDDEDFSKRLHEIESQEKLKAEKQETL